MISRTTSQMMAASAQRNLQLNKARLSSTQDQASSLKKMERPSDNPTGTANSLQVRASQRAAEQYGRNIDNGNGWLTTIDTAMSNVTNILNKARDLAIQGGSGAISTAGREAIALEIEGLGKDLLNQANTKYLGRSVFAGNSDAGAAFTGTPPTFTGASGSTVERRIAEGQSIRVDADGAVVFGNGDNSVFALMGQIAADLRAGLNTGPRVADIDVHLDNVIANHTSIGARHSRLLRAQDMNTEHVSLLETQRAEIEDVDLAEMLLELNVQDMNYQAALGVTAKVLPPTLMDFLR
ncbi:flagellar hook-associated protein 3 [Arthrobacter crystallopoietes BAB-32]|uniref:Flagellar hook-associated protein 3 n=1 Tax=Arthrobacter crystallopoietes BAB-32 TaxID=1246476 RepID=N1UUI6_9MICC|nr:flagellar hook-associated protein FlgL [Arthrobacter crystallopoietes]EMY34086.1 flagellar hook-associated protein 3 [Arthrobacter crystallopoietes BAB-32]